MNIKRFKNILQLLCVAVLLGGCAAKDIPERKVVFPPPPDVPRLEWLGTFHSEHDFKRKGLKKALHDAVGGGPVDGFSGPVSVAVNIDGKILVSDLYHQSIKTLDLENQDIGFLVSASFRNNLGITTDQQGRIYVADGKTQKVLVYDKAGAPLSAIGGGGLVKPAFLAINESLGRLYVSDPPSHDIKVYSLAGEFLFSFGGVGGNTGRFNVPQGIAIDTKGKVFVADMMNARIQTFTPDGDYIDSFGSRGTLKSQFETPKALAFDTEGHLYVVDSRRPNFRIFEPDGTLLLVVGSEERSDHKLGFALPVAIHVDQLDRVFVVDLMNRRVAVWQYLSEAYKKRAAQVP